jgi:hypothetical protein
MKALFAGANIAASDDSTVLRATEVLVINFNL